MRSRFTMTGFVAAALMGCPMVACDVLGQDEGRGRIIRKSGQTNERPVSQGRNSQQRARQRIISRMRQGSGNGNRGDGTWMRDFAEPAPYQVTVEDLPDSFSVQCDRNGMLRTATTQPMYSSTQCTVDWSIEPTASGVDLTYHIANETGEAQALPTLQIGGLDLGDVIEHLDHRTGCEWETLDASGGQGAWSAIAPYPQSLYSPVIIARNDETAVGLSMDYPLFGYKHQIRTYLGRGTGRYGDTWAAKFYLDGELAAGVSRDYVVKIRYTNSEDWIHTIAPYKESFARHGNVRYQQDLRPVWGVAVSDSLLIRSDNRRGFRGTRADLNGWQGDVDYILDWVLPAGFERTMVWSPAGMYDGNRHNNYPPQFMSDWTGPMIETESQWQRFADEDIELMFWWGRAGQYADRWDDDELDKFEPTNLSQSRMMLDQWREAIRRGATGVGLDAFTQMDGWQAIAWVALLRELKPNATIVAEPACFDQLNLHCPVSLYSTDLEGGPHLLADYLVPGREMWVIPREGPITREKAEEFIGNGMTVLLRGQSVTANELRDAVERAQGSNQGS